LEFAAVVHALKIWDITWLGISAKSI
jgi:hypothetical protein